METNPIFPVQDDIELTDLNRESAQFPGICYQASGAPVVHWQSYHDNHDTLRVARADETPPTDFEEISGSGQVLYPVCFAHGDMVWYAWSEYANGRWSICARCLADKTWKDTVVVETGEALFYPYLFHWHGNVHLLWTRQHKDASQAVMCSLSLSGISPPKIVSLSKKSYRAKACQGGDGNLYIVYDAYLDGTYKLLSRVRTTGRNGC